MLLRAPDPSSLWDLTTCQALKHHCTTAATLLKCQLFTINFFKPKISDAIKTNGNYVHFQEKAKGLLLVSTDHFVITPAKYFHLSYMSQLVEAQRY
jgi:hypothetical protein